jgi:hypothetical protein
MIINENGEWWAISNMFILPIPDMGLHSGSMSSYVDGSLQCLAWLENYLHQQNGRFYP